MAQLLTAYNNVVLTEKDFLRISDVVYKHCGIHLSQDKSHLVHSRLSKILRKGNFESFGDYIDYLLANKDGKEFSMFIDSLSTNLTSFFREEGHFRFLSNHFLPELMEKKRGEGDCRIRVWSAGCSSGEEPYSLAIALDQAIGHQSGWDIKILASDISTRILETAKKGEYSQDKVAPIPLQQRHMYFNEKNINGSKVYQVNEKLRSNVIFRYLNLMKDWPVRGPIDFIFCRNVMIYFDKPTQELLANRYWDLLGHGGVLFTGHSESLTGINHKFNYLEPTIYMKG